jgi:thiol reductant ABC exporter CydC subunit
MRTVLRLLGLARGVLPRLALAALAGFTAAACGIGLMATAAWLIARASQHPPVLELGVAVVAVRGFGMFRGIARYVERLAGHDAALRVLAKLRVRSYQALIPQTAVDRGDALQQFVSDVDAGQDLLVRVLLPYAAAVLAGAAAVGLLGSLLPAGAWILALLLVVVFLVAPAAQSAVARRAQAATAPLRADLTSGVVELLSALPDLVAYGWASARLERLVRVDGRLRRVLNRSSVGVGLGNALVVLAGGACVWLLLAVGRHRLDVPALAVLVLTPLAVLDVVSTVPEAAGRAGVATNALRRVYAVLDRPDPVPDPPLPQALPDGPYHLTVEDVTAGWGSPALHGVCLDLPPGGRVAVVGPSGCGKTTLACLLVRFLDPQAGRVALNGVDLRGLAGDDVRRVIALMDESAHCFDTTIEANLRVGRREASDDDLWDVLRQVRLAGWISTLPCGLSTEVGENGARLSGGQRRRLALARTLLTGAPILVLDEPTEHLDEPTAAALTQDLLAATTDRSLLLITHRPFGLSQVDTVLRLDAPPPLTACALDACTGPVQACGCMRGPRIGSP